MLCAVFSISLAGCSFSLPFINNNQTPTYSPVPTGAETSTPDFGIDPEAFEDEDETPTLEEYVDYINTEYENMSDEERAELDGVNFKFQAKDNNILVMKVWVDGVAALVYGASNGDKDALAEYDDFLASNREEAENIHHEFLDGSEEDFGVKISGIEFWIMNDVNPDNLLIIFKNGQVVYDTVYGINLMDLGSAVS